MTPESEVTTGPSTAKLRSTVASGGAQKPGKRFSTFPFSRLWPGYGRWLCVICGDCPASFSIYVVYIGPLGTANGRFWAREGGYELSTKWATQACKGLVTHPGSQQIKR